MRVLSKTGKRLRYGRQTWPAGWASLWTSSSASDIDAVTSAKAPKAPGKGAKGAKDKATKDRIGGQYGTKADFAKAAGVPLS
jgi:hypothetical protein